MYTHYVKMQHIEAGGKLGPMRWHHASSSLEDARSFVNAMTVGWEPECQACGGAKHLQAIDGLRDAQPCGWCKDGQRPGPRFGSTELAYDPARFEIGALDGFVIRSSGAIVGHERTEEAANAEIDRLVAAHFAGPSVIVEGLRRRRKWDEERIQTTVRSIYSASMEPKPALAIRESDSHAAAIEEEIAKARAAQDVAPPPTFGGEESSQ
jgi:hypothetical protein